MDICPQLNPLSWCPHLKLCVNQLLQFLKFILNELFLKINEYFASTHTSNTSPPKLKTLISNPSVIPAVDQYCISKDLPLISPII